MSKHGNSYQNEGIHHLYEILDLEASDTFKYGINDEPLNRDGSSPRANEQVMRIMGLQQIKSIQILGKARPGGTKSG